MKVVVVKAFGGLDQLEERDIPLPEVKPHQVRVKLSHAAFNPVDVKLREGKLGAAAPLILGVDAAGTVDAVGEGVQKFKVGQEVYVFVFGLAQSNGSYAEYTVVPEEMVAWKPTSLSLEQAASLPTVGLTALDVLYKSKVTKGTPVFVAGASGGVGSILVPLLRHAGASPIITTAGSDASADYIHKHLGIPTEHIVRYDNKTTEELVTLAQKHNNGLSFPVAIDLVGGQMKTLAFAVLAVNGHVLTIVEEEASFVTPLYPSQSPHAVFLKDGTFSTVFVGSRGFNPDRTLWRVYQQWLEELAHLIDVGEVKIPHVTNVGVLGVESVRKAHVALADGHVKGKLVVTIRS